MGRYDLESSNGDKMSDAGNIALSGTVVEYQDPPIRTMRRVFEDRSAHINEFDYLVGLEHPQESYAPGPDLKSTLFHKGFNRHIVKGQVEARAAKEQIKVKVTPWIVISRF
jgi:hypothetical protein